MLWQPWRPQGTLTRYKEGLEAHLSGLRPLTDLRPSLFMACPSPASPKAY